MIELTPRSQSILGEIVDMYTQTGQPVGSKALMEHGKINLSSASIRNVMADLERQGLLISPHTSAGRVPTEEGFRLYVKGLVEVSEEELDKRLQRAVDEQVVPGKNFNQILTDVSNTLSSMSSCAGLVLAPRHDLDELEQVEFVRLSGDRVLAVLSTKQGNLENRVINVPDHITTRQLNEAAKRLRDVVEGKTLGDARVMMMQALMEHKTRVDNMMEDMLSAAEMWGEPTVTDGALVVSGTQNLFQYPELVRDQLRELFTAFEEKRMLMALMNEVQKGDGVQVFIGKDCPIQAAKDCALISTSYGTDDKKIIGTLGVVGPMRMNYKQTIQLVDYTGKALSRALSEQSETKE